MVPTDVPRMSRIASVINAAASGRASARMLAAIAWRRDSSSKQRREMIDERVAERLFERRFVDHGRSTGGGDDVGIGQLIGFDVARIGHQHGRHTGQRQFGERRAARPADDQIAGEHHGRHFVDERHGERFDTGRAVAIDRLLQLAFARLMDDLPTSELRCRAVASARGMNSLMLRAPSAPPITTSRRYAGC